MNPIAELNRIHQLCGGAPIEAEPDLPDPWQWVIDLMAENEELRRELEER